LSWSVLQCPYFIPVRPTCLPQHFVITFSQWIIRQDFPCLNCYILQICECLSTTWIFHCFKNDFIVKEYRECLDEFAVWEQTLFSFFYVHVMVDFYRIPSE
jgi:hypothetical protein